MKIGEKIITIKYKTLKQTIALTSEEKHMHEKIQ